MLSAEAANHAEAEKRWGDCPLCMPTKKKVSYYESSGIKILEGLQPRFPIATQALLVKGHRGPTDAVLLLDGSLTGNKLLIEFDGQQHFSKSYGDTSLMKQKEIDEDKDTKAFAQGLKVQRLHFEDLGIWLQTIKGAIELAQKYPNKGFVLYSKSYYREPLKSWEKAPTPPIL